LGRTRGFVRATTRVRTARGFVWLIRVGGQPCHTFGRDRLLRALG